MRQSMSAARFCPDKAGQKRAGLILRSRPSPPVETGGYAYAVHPPPAAGLGFCYFLLYRVFAIVCLWVAFCQFVYAFDG